MSEPFTRIVATKCRDTFGGDAEIAAMITLSGDASSRSYHRLTLSGSQAPNSAIAMELPAGSGLPLSSEELAIFSAKPKELPFLNIQRFLSQIGVRVPQVYGAWEADGLILLEDLGDKSLWDQVQGQNDEVVVTWYKRAIDELLTLQVHGMRAMDNHCLAFQQRFDARLYNWEFEHFIEWGLEKRPGSRVKTPLINELRYAFTMIANLLDSQPACLNHRDYHSWNLMIHDNHVAVIDFQDALLAPAQYDLASLLNDRITDQVVRPELEQTLLHYYRDNYAAIGGTLGSKDEFSEIYRYSAIQRDLKVVGRFYYLDLVKGKPGYKKFIPPTVKRLQRNLAILPQTKTILSLLGEEFEAMV